MKTFSVYLLIFVGLTLGILALPDSLYAQRDERVLDPGEMVQNLTDHVIQLELDTGLTDSLLAKLDAAAAAIERQEPNVAVHQLRAFQREVHAKRTLGYRQGIFIYTGDGLSAQADLIVTVINSPEQLLKSNDLVYRGGTIIQQPKVYITYWDWGTQHADPAGERAALEGFLNAIGGTDYLNLLTQYYQITPQYPYLKFIQNPSNILKGVWFDDDNPMPTGYDSSTKQTFKWAEVEQIQKEAFRSILYFGYCEDCIYFIVTPPDRRLINWTAAAYHSSFNFGGTSNSIAYVDLPYQPDLSLAKEPGIGPIGATTILAYHELVEAMTDPRYGDNPVHEGTWFPSNFGWVDNNNLEIADKCGDVNVFIPQDFVVDGQTYKVPELWSNAIHNCTYTLP